MASADIIRQRLQKRFEEISQNLRASDFAPGMEAPAAPAPPAFDRPAPGADLDTADSSEVLRLEQQVDTLKAALAEARERFLLGDKERELALEAKLKKLEGVHLVLQENARRQMASLEESRAQVDAARGEISALQDAVRHRDLEIERWRSQLQDAEEKIAARERESADAAARLAAAQQDLENMKALYRAGLSQAEHRQALLESQLEEQAEAGRRLAQRQAALQKEGDEKERTFGVRLDALLQKSEQAEALINALRQDLSSARRERDELQKAADQKDQELAGWKTRFDDAEEELQELHAQLARAQAELKETKFHSSQGSDNLAALQRAVVEREQWLEENKRVLESLRAQLEAKDQALSDAREGRAPVSEDVKALQDAVAERDRRLTALTQGAGGSASVEGLVGELKIKEEKLAALTAEKERLFRDLSQKVGQLTQENKLLETRLAKTIAGELTGASDQKAFEEKEKRLQNQVDAAQSRVTALEKDKSSLEARLQGAEAELKKAQEIAKALEAKIQEMEKGAHLMSLKTETIEQMERTLRDAFRLMAPTDISMKAARKGAAAETPAKPLGRWARFKAWLSAPLLKIPFVKKKPPPDKTPPAAPGAKPGDVSSAQAARYPHYFRTKRGP